MKTLSSNENNPTLIIMQKMKLLLPYGENNSLGAAAELQKISSFLGDIMSSPATGEVFFYLLHNNAATSWVLQVHLDMPEATVYRTIKRLRALGVVEPGIKVSKSKTRGGPRPIVWVTPLATSEDAAKAYQLHLRALSPKYRVAEKVVQDYIDEYLSPRFLKEVNRRDVVQRVRDLKLPYTVVDIAEIACELLIAKGIVVYR